MGAIHVLDVSLPQAFHEPTAAIGGLRRQQKMNVVGHEAICMDGAPRRVRKRVQVMQVEPVVILRKETGAVVVATLYQVGSNAGKHDARSAGHVGGRELDRLANSTRQS